MNPEITIIGGGPAGSAAGILLARRGFRVRILEKNPDKKLKVCGEFLSPASWTLFDQLKVSDKLLALQGNKVQNVVFSGNEDFEVRLPGSGYGISRIALDSLLLNTAKDAGCKIEYWKVEQIQNRQTHFEISGIDLENQKHSLETDFVINAAGKLALGKSPELSKNQKIGFKAHFTGPDPGDTLKLFFFDGGYFGLVGIEEGKINCCGIVKKEILKHRDFKFDALLEEAAAINPRFAEWFASAKRLTDWATCAPLVHGRWSKADKILHAGDSACFVEPFLGQGMTLALAAGFALNTCLEKIPKTDQDWKILQNRYHLALKRLYRSRIGTGNLLNLFAFSLNRSRWAINTAHKMRFLADYLIRRTCTLPDRMSLCLSN